MGRATEKVETMRKRKQAPAQGPARPGSLGLVDGSLEFLLQLPHAAHGRIVPGRRLLVHQLAPCLGLLRLHDLRMTAEVSPAKSRMVPCWGITDVILKN